MVLPQARKQKGTYFIASKILENFEGNPHWYYKTYSLSYIFTIFQNEGGNAMGEI